MLKKIPNNIVIRNYKKRDFSEISKIWIDLDLGRPERGDDDKVIEKTLLNGGVFFVMEDISNDNIIGTSWITNDMRRLYLHHFGIEKNNQGKGLAKPLLETSLEWAKKTGLQIKLEVHKSNTVAIHLYEKYFFKYLGDYLVYIIRDYK